MFVDTHCHLNMMVDKARHELLTEEQLTLAGQIVDAAHEQGVTKIINVGTNLLETRNAIALAQKFPQVWATAGIHPCDLTEDWTTDFAHLTRLVANAGKNRLIAIGETGIDFYHKPFNKQRQKDAFKAHIELALTYNLPLVIHIREAADDALALLEHYRTQVRGVLHCFSFDRSYAKEVTSWGFFIGIDGPVTYPKNQELRDVVHATPLDHLLLETDAPFLPVQEMRGKQNSPVYLPLFAQVIADIKGISLQALAQATSKNVDSLFGI
jgi:TatD DNase family protein